MFIPNSPNPPSGMALSLVFKAEMRVLLGDPCPNRFAESPPFGAGRKAFATVAYFAAGWYRIFEPR
jgi:hypothetical protein